MICQDAKRIRKMDIGIGRIYHTFTRTRIDQKSHGFPLNFSFHKDVISLWWNLCNVYGSAYEWHRK